MRHRERPPPGSHDDSVYLDRDESARMRETDLRHLEHWMRGLPETVFEEVLILLRILARNEVAVDPAALVLKEHIEHFGGKREWARVLRINRNTRP